MLRIIVKNAPQFTLVSLSPVGSDSVLDMKMRALSTLDELKELLAITEQCAAQALMPNNKLKSMPSITGPMP